MSRMKEDEEDYKTSVLHKKIPWREFAMMSVQPGEDHLILHNERNSK